MNFFIDMILTALQQGLIYAVVAMGVYISYKILDFPDLSVDSTFPLGGVVSVGLIVGCGVNPVLAVLASFIAGCAAGAVTGVLHVKCKISKLLSGILVMTALLSVTLAITKLITGSVSVIIGYNNKTETLFNSGLAALFNSGSKTMINLGKTLVLLIVVLFVKILMDLFFKTKTGFMLKASGDNEQLVVSLGQDVGIYKILGLSLANGLVALAGSVYSQNYNYYDNQSGVGMVVIALASVIIGSAIFRKSRIVKGTTAVIIGALIYSACLSLAVNIGINTIYLKLVMAVIFTVVLILNNFAASGAEKSRMKRR